MLFLIAQLICMHVHRLCNLFIAHNLELLLKGGPLRFKYDPCENALMI